jgi:hypothetical protein
VSAQYDVIFWSTCTCSFLTSVPATLSLSLTEHSAMYHVAVHCSAPSSIAHLC